ncbi:T9SS type A sorting domain-containing protein [Marinoscillum pacificum]|uniref:T9SS type A sorting domain-containing protein n=1 Tax=Marinoscillum pacificum TaxID=392723 RepID=UPI002156FE1D|nr:T9SS type A sorting domain-containing protein [Marinoscillum pacificum]
MKFNSILLLTLFTLSIHTVNSQDFTINEISNLDFATNQGDYIRSIDYDNDGDLDILQTGGTNSTELKVLINDGSGTFEAQVIKTYTQSIEIETGDLDNDGDEDMLVYSYNMAYEIFENQSGSFTDPVTTTISGGILRLADIVDVDGDGLNDIVTAVYNPSNIVWARNEGDFSFAANEVLIPQTEYNAKRINYFEILDIDNDNDLDAFVITDGTGSTDLLYMTINNTTDTVTTTISPSSFSSDYFFGDLNADDHIDIAFSTVYGGGSPRGEIHVQLNDQTNSFSSTIIKSYPLVDGTVPLNCNSLEAVDFDGDNDFDLVVGETSYQSAGITRLFINDGAGSFTENPNRMIGNLMRYNQAGTGIYTTQVESGDYNDDGLDDLLILSGADKDMILHAQQADGSFEANYLNYHMEALTRIQYLDVDGDGFKDFISTDQTANGKVLINYNDGNQNFKGKEAVVFDNVSRTAMDVLIGNWNNNSDLDLFYANTKHVYLVNDFLNESIRDTTLIYTSDEAGVNAGIGLNNNTSNALELIDVDNDNDLDLFIVDNISNQNTIVWLENTGTGYNIYSTTIDLDSYQLIDLNSDNYPDLVYTKTVGTFERYVRIAFFNSTTKQWDYQSEENTENVSPIYFTMADVDVDGDKDVIFRGRWMENTGNGVFAEDLTYQGGIGSTGKLTSADLNNDSRDDLISITEDGQDPTYIDVFINEGSNTFTKTQLGTNLDFQGTGHGYMPLLVEDIDEDGQLDIVSSFSGFSGGYVLVWFKTCFSTSSSISRSSCGDYTAPSGAVFTTSGTYEDIITNSAGCDSVITIDLTIHPVYNQTASAEICEGDTYDLGSQSLTTSGEFTEVFTASNGCDSTVVLTLTVNPVYNETAAADICDGDTYTFGSQSLSSSGEYTELFESVSGCDSTVVLTLTVNEVYNETATVSICEGDTYIFGNQSLTSAGQYTEVLTASTGCDSTVVLTLQVNPTYNETASANICSGDSYLFGSQTLTAAGEYTEVFASTTGCDSTVVLSLQVDPIYNETTSTSICAGDTFIFGGQTLSEAGEYTEVFESITGCDSTVVLTLSINEVYNETTATTICEGETYSFGSQQLSLAGQYSETFTSTTGCDSTVNLNLIVNPSFNEEISETICSGDFFSFDGSDLTEEGTYIATYQSTSGCDSLVTLDLVINNLDNGVSVENNTIISHQDGASYQWYDCDSNEPIDGANTQSFSPFNSGDYFVEISSYECTAVSECVTINATILSSKRSINLYPNPAQDYLQITDKSLQSLKYQIIDLSGKEAQSGSIPDSGIIELKIQKGTFLLLIDTEDKQIKHKFFKN